MKTKRLSTAQQMEDAEANARLIAAAPDLMAALEELEQGADRLSTRLAVTARPEPDYISKPAAAEAAGRLAWAASAALRKARGEQGERR